MTSDPLLELERELLRAAHRRALAPSLPDRVDPGAALEGLASASAPVSAPRTQQSPAGCRTSRRRLRGSRRLAALVLLVISFVIAGTAALGAVTGLWTGLPLGLLTTSAAPSRSNGVEVFLVPERLSQFTKDQYDLRGDVLGVLLSMDGQPAGGACCIDAAHIQTIGRGALTGEIPRGAMTIAFVLPDGVARVRLLFGRQVRPGGHVYRAPLTLDLPVHGNVAAATTTARGVDGLEPLHVTWYAADGHVVKAYTNPHLPANPNAVLPQPQPAPPTELSGRAEADPSTPNHVSIQPANGHRYIAHGRDHSDYVFSFTILLRRYRYAWSLSGPKGPTCHSPTGNGHDLGPGPLVRGQTFTLPEIPPPAGWCPGTYRLAVAAIAPNGHRYPPFGHATFRVSP
jgi:hypothetical protein